MSLADAVPFAVANWPLNEASGTRFDAVGSEDLTDNNTVGSGTGKFGTAADFEASNSEYLSHASNSTLQAGDIDFMFRAWVKLESTGSGKIIIGKDVDSPANSRDYTLDTNDSDQPRFYVNGGAGGLIAVWGSSLSSGTWYLVHGWHSATSNLVGIAVNAGTAVTASTGGTAPQTSSAQFRVGARAFGGAENYWDGLIEDVVFLKGYILNATERTEDYNGGTGVPFVDWAAGVPLPSFVYHYRQQGIS